MTPNPWTLNPDKIDIDNCEVKVEGAPDIDWFFSSIISLLIKELAWQQIRFCQISFTSVLQWCEILPNYVISCPQNLKPNTKTFRVLERALLNIKEIAYFRSSALMKVWHFLQMTKQKPCSISYCGFLESFV